jgi:hypothetical protein
MKKDRWLRTHALLPLLIAAFCALNPGLRAQSDNFDSGTDSGWVRVNVLSDFGGANTYSFPNGPFGKGYRIQCTSSSALLGACGNCGTARAVTYRTNVYSDFYASIDVVNWDNSLDQALVLMARATGLTDQLDPCPLPFCPPGFGTLNGYICNYDCNQDGVTAGDVRGGQFQINSVTAESTKTLASADVTLTPGKAYRMVLKGVGALLTARLYDLDDLSMPLATIQAQDTNYVSGVSGLISFSRDGTTTDATFDNYYAAGTDPNLDIAPAIRHPVPGTPQVLSRSPARRFTNLLSPSSGLAFTANTFSTSPLNASATKLFLNGLDVSASLAPFPADGTNVSFTTAANTLATNTIYSSRIELVDATGTLKSTNTFWFDTFSDSFLTNPPLKTVEVEDYNYSSGGFQLDPIPVSGFDTNDIQVNGNNVGYMGLDGTPEVDYHDNRTSPEPGWSDFRGDDFVGTLQGNREDIQDLNHPAPTTPPSADPARPNDDSRRKYTALGMKEYEVARTEAGEWLNYTRVFADTNYYVYLRCGSAGVQDVFLSMVHGDPTTTNQTTAPLGTFSVKNHLMRSNYRYEPLAAPGSSGVPIVLHLAGTNTFRLTMGGTPVKDNRLLFLNYLLFVPTSDGTTAFDNFNDGDDTNPPPAWVRYDPIGAGSWSFPGGNSYRIQSAPSPDPATFGQGRAGSLLPGSYNDFYVAADLVAWDDTIHQICGVMARIGTPGPGTTTGYLFTHDRGNPSSSTGGDMDIVRLDGEVPTSLPTTGTDSIHLEPGKSYRFAFIGKGTNFTGMVYELPNTSVPVVTITATDDTYASGSVGLVVANNSSETGFDGPADATFDNFLATTAEPRLAVTASAQGVILSWPMIPFVLKSTPSLSSPSWSIISTGITQLGASNIYLPPPTATPQFYRLSFP